MRIEVALALTVAMLASPADASPQCPGCNIVREGAFTASLPGHYVYEWLPRSRRFLKVTIVSARTTAFGPEVMWQDANGRTWWNDARNYYTEQAMLEIQRGLASVEQSPSQAQQQTGQAATCASALAAKRDGNWLLYGVMRNACCNSTASKTYGTPPGLCN